ncbi:MAG: hypothetical protein ABH823_05090 [bacterium]
MKKKDGTVFIPYLDIQGTTGHGEIQNPTFFQRLAARVLSNPAKIGEDLSRRFNALSPYQKKYAIIKLADFLARNHGEQTFDDMAADAEWGWEIRRWEKCSLGFSVDPHPRADISLKISKDEIAEVITESEDAQKARPEATLVAPAQPARGENALSISLRPATIASQVVRQKDSSIPVNLPTTGSYELFYRIGNKDRVIVDAPLTFSAVLSEASVPGTLTLAGEVTIPATRESVTLYISHPEFGPEPLEVQIAGQPAREQEDAVPSRRGRAVPAGRAAVLPEEPAAEEEVRVEAPQPRRIKKREVVKRGVCDGQVDAEVLAECNSTCEPDRSNAVALNKCIADYK